MNITTLWFLLLLRHCYPSPISIPDDASYRSQSSIGRNLLQAKKHCPVNFESMNYTIITSRCKGPNYLANLCCPAFKEFACPYYRELDDLSNDCSLIMFSYINRYGDYPPGVFSSLCHDDRAGLACDPVPLGQDESELADGSNGGPISCSPTLQLIVIAGLLLFF
ncbi:hypothetical protein R6Q59_015736 [Mikania micrantha]